MTIDTPAGPRTAGPEHDHLADNETQAIARVVEMLAAAFPSVPLSQVRGRVERILATFDEAKVRSYIPILLAREARAELSASSTPG